LDKNYILKVKMWITKKYVDEEILEMPNSLINEVKLFIFLSIFSLLSTRVIISLDIYTRVVVILITYI